MSLENDKTARIARLNDEFRQRVALPPSGAPCAPGRYVMTSGVAALPRDTLTAIFESVREFSAFSLGNDPHGEHDFGAVSAGDAESVFWKIDYYADSTMEMGSEDPHDPERSFRVLTVMLAAEY